MKKTAIGVLSLALFATAGGSQTFNATLAGIRERPGPGDADGSGFASVSFDGTTVNYFIWTKAIDQPTAAHIHTGRAGESGGVTLDFAPTFVDQGGNVWAAAGTLTAAADVIQTIVQNPSGHYFNVHTGPFPAGAVRGQVLGDGTAANALVSTLKGSRESNGGAPDGTGYAAVVLDDSSAYYFLWVKAIATPTAAHIHAGDAGTAGPVVLDFASPTFTNGVAFGRVAASATVIRSILARPDSYYFNVHTGDFPGGAVRGQAGPSSSELFFPVLARNAGLGGANFRSDIRILNLTDEDASLYFEWFPKGGGGAQGPARVVFQSVIAGGEAVFDDAIGTLFNVNDRGAIRILSSFPLRAVANTYNDQRAAGNGTYGGFLEAIGLENARTSGGMALNSHRPQGDRLGFRTNLGYFNPNPFPVNVTFNVRRPGGSLIGSPVLATFQPWANDLAAYYQVVGGIPPADQTQENFFVTFTASAPVFLFTSVVDNVTSDNFHQPALAFPAGLVTLRPVSPPSPTPSPSPTPTPTPPAVTFASLKNTIFTPRCSGCHPPNGGGMDLTEANAYASIVNVSSFEQPALLRIKPSDPDNSYLYRKVTGAPGISGSKMPLGGSLTQAQIDALRGWILAGAPNN